VLVVLAVLVEPVVLAALSPALAALAHHPCLHAAWPASLFWRALS
jgi:hypothetical protein